MNSQSQDPRRGRAYVLSAPSGAGKTSLAKALLAELPSLALSVSHTTRAPRPGEIPGVHYHFVSDDQFKALRAANAFFESAEVFGHWYGTSRAALEARLGAGHDVLLDIDWQGARRVKAEIPEAVTIFVMPPSREILRERLTGRGQDSHEVIERRMAQADAEMGHVHEFDHVVLNDRFESALADLTAIVRTGRPLRARHVTAPALENTGHSG